jgi:hypothetical protein
VNSAIVNKEIRAVIRPFLQTHGFRSFTPRTAWRYGHGRVDVVNFQSFNSYLAEGLGCTTFSFCVNLGIYLPAVPHDSGREPKRSGQELRPEEWQCHLRLHLQRGIDQPELPRRDIWLVDEPGRYLAVAVRDARRAIAESGLAWFERWADDAVLLEALRADVGLPVDDRTQWPGNADSPARNYATGYVALARGERQVAAEYLARALAQYEAIDASNAEISRRFTPLTPERLRADVRALAAAV